MSNRISNFLRGILQKIIIWAYTPDADELKQMRADDLAKIAELAKQAANGRLQNRECSA